MVHKLRDRGRITIFVWKIIKKNRQIVFSLHFHTKNTKLISLFFMSRKKKIKFSQVLLFINQSIKGRENKKSKKLLISQKKKNTKSTLLFHSKRTAFRNCYFYFLNTFQSTFNTNQPQSKSSTPVTPSKKIISSLGTFLQKINPELTKFGNF